MGLTAELAGRAARPDVGRENVLAVADVHITTHKIRSQDFCDVSAPRFTVAGLVHLLVAFEREQLLIWKLVVDLPVFHADNKDPKATNFSVSFADFWHPKPENVFPVPAVVEPLNAVELFAAWRSLPHLAANRGGLKSKEKIFR